MANRGRWPGMTRAAALLLALPVLAGPVAFTPAAALETEAAGPDFSDVTTKAAARKLVRQGKLVEILYFPAEFGGPEEPDNIGFVTPQAADDRAAAIDVLGDQLERGLINQMMVSPDYRGDSVVPSSITMSARHSQRGISVDLTIAVW